MAHTRNEDCDIMSFTVINFFQQMITKSHTISSKGGWPLLNWLT